MDMHTRKLTARGWSAGRRAGIVAIAAGGMLAGCYTLPTQEAAPWVDYVPPPPLAADVPRAERNRQVFEWAWTTVKIYYYDAAYHGVDWAAARERHRPAAETAKDDDELYAAINAMLGELKDGHTRARSPREVAEKREHRRSGIGLEVAPLRETPDRVVITDVWPRGPAAKAGVRRGWILLSCNGQDAGAILKSRRWQEGERVRCVFLDRADRRRTVDLAARSVYVPPVRAITPWGQYCVYVRFDEFKVGDARWLYRQLLLYDGTPNLILDLRYNTGGDIFCLESIAGLFLPAGQVLGTAVRPGISPRAITSHPPRYAPTFDGRIAVIVSAASASAAEILANALRDRDRSVVVGQRTVGHVLNAYQGILPDGGELSFSIRDFLAPDGQRLEGRGVEPEVPVSYHIDVLRAGGDPGIATALAVLQGRLIKPDF
jgi:carboxyl-terminal processing protease